MGTFAKKNSQFISAGAARSLNAGADADKTVFLDSLTGSTVTLPKATGAGTKMKVFERLAATSGGGHVIKVRDSVDIIQGQVTVSGTTTASFAAAAADDTITLNRTTTGGAVRGSWFDFLDVAPGIWSVRGVTNGSGAVATPFSSGV